MFYDYAKIYAKGGDGGNGIVAFRREKYVPEGGPSGGDGGKGGDVILIGDEGLRTLVDLRYKRHYKGDRGEHGMGKHMHGKGAEDLVVRVPLGTVIRNADTKELIADMTVQGQEVVIAKGGRGGRGNARFATAHDKAPTFSEKGEPGEELWIELELKLLADVGLVGFPNAGKSTIISKISAAKPKIADYPFTTITPNLGVVRVGDEYSFVVADVPGLIEGAHEGVGLGHKFLRHVERTKVLVHVLDMAGTDGRKPWDDFEIINSELKLYNPRLALRPQIIAANKLDMPEAEENLKILTEKIGSSYEIFPISALNGSGLSDVVYRLGDMLRTLPDTPPEPEEEKLYITIEEEQLKVIKEDDVFVVKGKDLERVVAMTDFDNDAAIERLQRIMDNMGVEETLKEHGIKPGDTVRIGKMEFDFQENFRDQ